VKESTASTSARRTAPSASNPRTAAADSSRRLSIADQTATTARTAAASGAVAHAVAAASGAYAPDTTSDANFAAWSASTSHPADIHLAQNAHLLKLIAGTRAKHA